MTQLAVPVTAQEHLRTLDALHPSLYATGIPEPDAFPDWGCDSERITAFDALPEAVQQRVVDALADLADAEGAHVVVFHDFRCNRAAHAELGDWPCSCSPAVHLSVDVYDHERSFRIAPDGDAVEVSE